MAQHLVRPCLRKFVGADGRPRPGHTAGNERRCVVGRGRGQCMRGTFTSPGGCVSWARQLGMKLRGDLSSVFVLALRRQALLCNRRRVCPQAPGHAAE